MENTQNIAAVVEMLSNIQFIAAAYNQIWTIKVFDTPCGKQTVAFIDERNGEEKMIFHNPDSTMAALIPEIGELGWIQVKTKYLSDGAFAQSRVRLCEQDSHCHCCH